MPTYKESIKSDFSNFQKLEKVKQEKVTKVILSNANIYIIDEMPTLNKSFTEKYK